MKKFLLPLFFVISLAIQGQSFQFVLQNNPNVPDLKSIYFPDHANGFAVGSSGTIVASTDSGYTWHAQSSGTAHHLYSVYFLNSNKGWAVGDSGTILKTTNGGLNWLNMSYSTVRSFSSVYCTNSDTCFVTTLNYSSWPPLFLRTTNGGLSWINDSIRVNSTYFSSEDTGFVAECDTIYQTFNGGTNWNPVAITNTCGCLNYRMSFPSPNIGYAFSDEKICKTTNGGSGWFSPSYIWQPSAYCFYLSSVSFSTTNAGFATGNGYWGLQCENWNQSGIYRTTNGGNNWFSVNNPASSYLINSSFFTDSATGFVCGGWFNSNGFILRTGNGATSKNNLFLDEDKFSVFPNPCINFLQLNNSNASISNFTYELLDLQGVILLNGFSLQKNMLLDISKFNKGIYFLRLQTASGVIFKKIIKI